jgi:hypothetical protein
MLDHPVGADLSFQVLEILCSCAVILRAEASTLGVNHFEFLFADGRLCCDVYQY